MMASTYTKLLWNIAEEYQKAGESWPATARAMVLWARKRKLLAMRESDIIGRLADDLSRALREQYYRDPQGRTVRAKHCARLTINGEQTTLWDDHRTAEREFMAVAVQQRRQQIVGDCRQLALIEVPWDEANRQHRLKFALLNEDGQPVLVPTPIGDRPLEIEGDFEVGRPPGHRPGTLISLPLAFNLGPVQLAPGSGFVWKFLIDNESEESWRLVFSTRPVSAAPPSIPPRQ
jgi:hypothetical protein